MAEPTPLRRDQARSPHERILDLQKALNVEMELLEEQAIIKLHDAAADAFRASEATPKVGVRQEFAKLSTSIKEALQRIEAIRSR